MVGDIDDLHPVLDCQRRILGGGNTFQDEWDLEVILESFDVVPVEPRLLDLAAMSIQSPGGRGVTFREVAFTARVNGQIHRETECVKPRLGRALRMPFYPPIALTHIQLIDLGAWRGGGNHLERWLAHRAMHTDNAKLAGRPSRGSAPTGVEVLKPADRRQHQRDTQIQTQQMSACAGVGHIPQHPRPEGQGIQCLTIPAQRRLGLRSSD